MAKSNVARGTLEDAQGTTEPPSEQRIKTPGMSPREAAIVRSAITTFNDYQGITVDALRQGAAEIRCLVEFTLRDYHLDSDVLAMITGIGQRLEAAADLAIETEAFDVPGGGQ